MKKKGTRIIKDSAVAREFTRMVNASEKTQFQISEEAGLSSSNLISMFKQGRTVIPIHRIPALCRACGEKPSVLLALALQEYQPELWEVLRSHYTDLAKNHLLVEEP